MNHLADSPGIDTGARQTAAGAVAAVFPHLADVIDDAEHISCLAAPNVWPSRFLVCEISFELGDSMLGFE